MISSFAYSIIAMTEVLLAIGYCCYCSDGFILPPFWFSFSVSSEPPPPPAELVAMLG